MRRAAAYRATKDLNVRNDNAIACKSFAPALRVCSLQGRAMNNTTNTAIDFAKSGGIVPAIVQDDGSGDILMLGYMNAEALEVTFRTGHVTFFSRSRQKLWTKGETSGHRLALRRVLFDCDADAILVRAVPLGPGVCHAGYRSCFYRELDAQGSARIIAERTFDPAAQGPGRQEQMP